MENSVNEESGIPDEVNSTDSTFSLKYKTDSFDLTIMGVNDAVNYISLNIFE